MVKEPVKARRRPLVFAWVAVAAILLAVIGSLFLHRPAPPTTKTSTSWRGAQQFNNPQPLTIADANALLAQAPSFKAAVDDMAFRPEAKPISEGRYSLVALLSKEETKQ